MAKKFEGADFFAAPTTTTTAAPAAAKTPKTKKTAKTEAAPAEADHAPALRSGSVTTCFKLDAALLAKLKAVAYWDRRKIKDVLEAALTDYLNGYEQANGPIDVNIPRNLV